MIKLNFIIAWRNLLKHRMVSFINILGLTLGLASSLLAILFAFHELTYENSHEKADRIAALYLYGNFGAAMGGEMKVPSTYGPEGHALKNMFPDVEAATISRKTDAVVRYGDRLFKEEHILLADSSFHRIFSIPFLYGSRPKRPETIALSETTANKYFGSNNPLGQTLNINFFGRRFDLEVTGVFKDFPSNTHLKADFIVPFSLSDRFGFWKYRQYESTDYRSYLLLRDGADFDALNKKVLSSFDIPLDFGELKVILMPLREMHFNGSFNNNKGKLLVFMIGGIFMLITSCFNYINLTNIIFATRAKETGVRKANGGTRRSIFIQFFSDSALSTFIAYLAALTLLYLALPWFNNLMNTHISLAGTELILSSVLLFVVTLLLCGLYPAIKYSAAKPASLIKNDWPAKREKSVSRTLLTSFQFFLAVLFVQVLLVMHRQTAYLSNENVIGYHPENVICLPGHPWGDLENVKTELLRNPGIEAVSWGSYIPSMGMNLTRDWLKDDNKVFAGKYAFEEDYFNVYQIKMLAGRFFSRDFGGEDKNIVINRKAADELGYADPVGKTLRVEGSEYTIIGIVENYLAQPPVIDYMPILIRKSGPQDNNLVIRINPENRRETHSYIAETLQKFNPDYPVNIKYHDDVLNEQEEAQSFISANQLINLFFTLTIATSLIGLFGLSVFIAQRRRKEVGIRKAMGASVKEIIYILSKGVILRMCGAAALATAIAVVAAQGYLSVFPMNFEPGFFFYLFGAFLSLAVLTITVSWQTWKAAAGNPVESLRYE